MGEFSGEDATSISVEVTPEVFLIPVTDAQGIAYSPMTHRACRVDLTLPIRTQVVSAGLAGPGVRVDSPFARRSEGFSPAKLTLFPTNRCGQRCRYCYAQAGRVPTLDMPRSTAFSAIDFVIGTTSEAGRDAWVLAFHGGGEPLLRFPWLREVVEYAQRESTRAGREVHAISSTGGFISNECAEWIARNFAHLVVSFEVLEDVQNAQRPSSSGRNSWEQVHGILRSFDERGFEYFIRTTVTRANVHRLLETAEAIAARYRCKLWHVEPMIVDAPLVANAPDLSPDMSEFAVSFLEAHARCQELGIRLQYSGAMLDVLSATFHCGVGDDNFAVTPDGCITACLNELSAGDPQAGRYTYGRVHPDGRIEIDDEKRRLLHRLDVRNIPWCRECFLKYHCAGDCVIRGGQEPFADRDNDRCRTNRVIATALLDRALSADDFERTSRDSRQSTVDSSRIEPESL